MSQLRILCHIFLSVVVRLPENQVEDKEHGRNDYRPEDWLLIPALGLIHWNHCGSIDETGQFSVALWLGCQTYDDRHHDAYAPRPERAIEVLCHTLSVGGQGNIAQSPRIALHPC